MSRKLVHISTLCGILALAGSNSLAWGQGFLDPNCCPQVCPPVQVQQCYQTVPVTEYRPVRQVVQCPVRETKYVDQPVTEYRQVVENKACVVPTVAYQTVTECRQVQRDLGRWVTNYHCRPVMAPCEYDNRPDLLGVLNRTGYSLRMAFTPKVYAERTYVPNVVTENIPVSRQVAVHGTKTVNYQVSRMVPYTTTRRVAVNTVRMVSQEIVTQQPVTVMRTVPVGSAYAFGGPINSAHALAPIPYGTVPGATALAPTPAQGHHHHGNGRNGTALAPAPAAEEGPISTAILPRREPRQAPAPNPAPNDRTNLPPALEDEGDVFDRGGSVPAKKSSYESDRRAAYDRDMIVPTSHESPAEVAQISQPAAPSAVTVGRWVARRTQPARSNQPTGPSFPEISIAGN